MRKPRNVTIRRCEPDDAGRIMAIFSQPGVYKMALDLPYTPARKWKDFVSVTSDNIYCLVAIIDNVVVGCSRFVILPKPCQKHIGTFGIFVDENYRRDGVGNRIMEAVIDLAENWLGMLKLEVTVSVSNQLCLNLCKKYGFEIEGLSKMFAYADGQYIDAYHLARIRGDNKKRFQGNNKRS